MLDAMLFILHQRYHGLMLLITHHAAMHMHGATCSALLVAAFLRQSRYCLDAYNFCIATMSDDCT